jgi:hypothetical protein
MAPTAFSEIPLRLPCYGVSANLLGYPLATALLLPMLLTPLRAPRSKGDGRARSSTCNILLSNLT